MDRKGRRMRILGRVKPWSRGSEVEAEEGVVVVEEEVEGMGTGAGREVGLAEASLTALALALDSERAAASWASFSLDLRIRRRVLEGKERGTGQFESNRSEGRTRRAAKAKKSGLTS